MTAVPLGNANVSKTPRILVVTNRNPWRHRRTREVIRAIENLGWHVEACGLTSEVESRDIKFHSVSGLTSELQISIYSVLARNAYRIAATACTVLFTQRRAMALLVRLSTLLRLTDGLQKTLKNKYDIIIVEDLILLPASMAYSGEAKVLFDAREFYPGHFDHSLLWKVFVRRGYRRIVDWYLPLCDAVTAISPGIAQAFETMSGREVHSVRNVPSGEVTDGSRRLRVRTDSAADGLRIVYHGSVERARRLDQLINVAARLGGKYSLDLYLVGRRRQIAGLKRKCKDVYNVRVLPPEPFDNISDMLAQYDMGIAYFPPTSSNLAMAMPSKFFEYLSVGLPVAIGPSTDMALIVQHYQCGVIAQQFTAEAMAAAIRSISEPELDEMRQGATFAMSELVAEKEYQAFQSVLKGLIST